MNKTDMFNRIKRIPFEPSTNPLFSLLEKHLERVEFVRDHIGLRDFLFIAEKEASEFNFPLFAGFDTPVIEDDNDKNNQLFNEYMIYEEDVILGKLSLFFKSTNRILYVAIGFKESFLSDDDMFLSYELLKSKVKTDKYEAMASVRNFPNWYAAKLPSDIIKQEKFVRDLEEKENYLLTVLRDDVLAEIKLSIKNNDEAQFKQLCSLYKTVLSDISEKAAN